MTEAQRDTISELKEEWPELDHDSRMRKFFSMERLEAEELFLTLSPSEQADLLLDLLPAQKRSWLRLLAPDDAADLIQSFQMQSRSELVSLLDEGSRKEVMALLAYAEDDAGGLMNPRYIRLRPEMSVEEAIRYLRAQARTPIETIYYAYVIDHDNVLVGVVSFRELLLAPPDKKARDIMKTELLTLREDQDQEEVSRIFSNHNLMAIPVVDAQGHMKGLITPDDILTVVEEEATEDIQKMAGVQALDAPYLRIGFFDMIRKRAGWLCALFVGESLTATALGHFEATIQSAVVLALFIPLIISSGGNTGSQTSTLIIRALALREIHLRDWWRVVGRELGVGLGLGLILGSIGFLRVYFWPYTDPQIKAQIFILAVTVSFSLIGVVIWGALAGSILPFILRGLRLDPATASAPFVATLVDVTGIIIYFSVSQILLKGFLL